MISVQTLHHLRQRDVGAIFDQAEDIALMWVQPRPALPLGRAATLPVRRYWRAQRPTVASPMHSRRPTARSESPSSTTSLTARSRKSSLNVLMAALFKQTTPHE